MTPNIVPFTFEALPVRSIVHDGEPWFHAADVCAALEYANPSQTVEDHVDPEDKAIVSIGLPGSPPVFINESGIYALILGSKKPQARKFKRWVTSEVLPSIRRTGAYGATAEAASAMAALQRVYQLADAELERRTRRDFYRDTPRTQEHREAAAVEVAAKFGLDAHALRLCNARGSDAVMAEVYKDPAAIARVERQREAIEADYRRRLALEAGTRRRSASRRR